MDKPGLRDALPQPKPSDIRTDPFWGNLDSSLSAVAAPSTAQTPQRDLNVGLGDVARGVGAGALDLVGGIGELARQASQFGKENAGKQGGDYLEQARANMASKLSPVLDVVAGVGDLAKSGAESLTEGMSGDAKEAIGRSLIDETPEGRLTMGDGAGDLDVWAMKMAQGVGSMVPTLLAGGVTGAAAKASIGRAVTTSMIKRGATQEVAEAVAAKTVAKLATGAAVTTGATGSVGSAGVNTRESVLGMSFDELSQSDTFRQAFTRIDQDQQTQHLSDEEKLSLAREETANVASRATMSDAKVWGAAAMGSVMGDAMLFKMLAGKAATGGVLKGAAKGAVGEGIGETLEEGVQQYTINESLNEVAAADIDPMKGVVSSALEGGLIGMGTGGALGGAGGLRGSKSQPESEGGAQVDPATVEDVAPVEPGDPMQESPAAAPADPGLTPAADAMADPVVAPSGEQSPLGPSASQFDELRDVPAYLRRDDTAERFKGMAADSEVQRALAGEFGQSVQELVASQMQAGDQGKSLYERAQAGELGLDPFAGNKSAQQVAMENQRPALPLKDVIFAGDANAARVMTKEGHFDDKQAGTGPQFRGAERTRWQSGQEGDVLPPESSSTKPAGELPGAVIEGEAREVGTELPHRDVVYGADQRQPDAKPMRGSATESAVGPLKTLRITRKGKPFATEKEATMASRKGKEMPVPLNGGGFGVAEIAEVEQVQAANNSNAINGQQGNNQPQAEVSNEPVTPVPAISSEGQGDQPGAGDQAAAGAGPAIAGLANRAGSGNPADNTPASPVPDGQQQDDQALTAPAPDAGVAVSEGAQPEPVQQIEAARAEVAPEPTDAQKEAGNYKKGHLKLQGLDIALENPKGSTRSGTDKDGKAWQSTMAHDYGYIKRTLGADGDHVDVFIGDRPDSETVYVVDQVDPKTGKFDEHKVMMGFADEQAAKAGYLANYEKGWKGLGSIKAMPVEEFKRWVKGGDTTKPANDWSGAKSAADYHAAKRRLFSGEMEFSEFQAMSRSALDNAPSLRAELEKKTKQDLLDQMSRFNAARYKNDKKAVVVEAAYNQLIGDLRWAANGDGNTISETYAIGGARQSIEERVAKALNGLTPERYQLFRDKQLSDVAEMQRRREELKQSLTDPQTLDDFKAFIERRGIDKLTQEQRARYEDMVAARNLDRREQERSAKGNETAPSTTSGDIIKTKHTKTGDDLFVVQMGERVERDAYNRINTHAKTLGGWYSSFRGKGAVPGFQFKSEEKATEFRAWLGGEVGGANPDVAPDQSTDSEAQPAGKSKQVEALRNRAASARAKAEAVFNADRKENTARRASMAANARANAERDLRFAGLLEAIATGIESGEITYLRNLANGAQLEELQSALNRGLWSLPATKIDALVSDGVINRDDSSRYSWSDKATPEQMVEGVSMPGMDYHTDRLREVALKMQGASGFKQAGAKVMSLVKAAANRDNKTTTLSDPELIAKLKAYVTGSDDYSTSTIKDQIAGYGRLERMGITNHTELRAALRELVRLQRGLNEAAPQRDPVTEKTNALKRRLLNNRNAFIDFFPTPEEYAADLVDRLGIEPGMVVLEPSAGHGMLAEAARDAGATVEAVELASDLRDILQEKGFSLVGNDFMETAPSQRYDAVIMNPPFSNDMDIDHVRHAFAHLKPGGRLAAIVSSMAGQRSNKKNKAFREWLDYLGASEEMMPEGAFKDSLNPTSVRTKIITIEKPVDSTANSDATEQRAVSFSKQAMAQGEKPAKHLTRKEAELVTKEWFKQYRGASGIDVQIHATQAELEKALGLTAQDGLIRRAAFDDDSGTLHVAADTIANPKRMREILRHEVLAHYGLANVLGDGEYTKLISRIIKSKSAPSMKAVWEWVDTHYAGEDVGVQAEEVIAHLAELEQSAWRRGWDQVVAWVTKALRTVGFVPGGITAAETRVLIEGLGKKMKRGGPDDGGPDGGQKFSQEAAQPEKKGGLKMSQTNTAADAAMEKLNLGAKPDIIDNTKANLAKLRKVDRGVVESWVDRFIKKANTEVLDALAPIKYAEDAAGITDAADSGYVAARMATGAASTMQATMLYGLPEWNDGVIQRKAGTGEKDALLGIFSDLGADLHNWLGWMAGHRAELLMEQGRENLLSEQDIAALKGLGNGKEAKFKEAKARWNRLNAATLDLAQEAGLFTKEARAEFESEWYIPFFRESEDGDVIAPFKPKGIANQNAGIKKLKGGEANTNDLLENIFTSTSKLIDASMKNMAAQKTVWNLADTGLIEVVAKPNMMDWRALKNGKDLITVKLEGEDYMIRVEDPDLYRAMTFFDRQPFGTMINMASKAKRLLTAGVTASPEFMLRNFLRDSLSSWAISKDGFKPVIDSIKGVKKTLAMDGSTIDVMFSGASFLGGYVNGNDPTAMADTVRKSLRRKGMTPEQIARYEKSIIRNAAQAKGVVANVWEKYNRYGEAFENANREAVYAAAIKAGKSHAQAAFESKDLMDFSMMGASRFIQGASLVLPFFNARLQGLGKLSRELRDNPREIAKRAGMITAMSLGLLAANWDDERYEELPDWDKDANWHFFVGDQHFRIPKPFEIGVMFGTIPERMVRAMGDKDTGAQFGKAVARAIGDTFALNPTPQLVKPLVEAAFNYDTFRGGPIDSPQDLAVKAEARYNEQTSLLMRELGELSGFSPKQLEHLVIGYTGTIGGYVMATADGLIRASRQGESASWRADEIPLVKAVYRGTGPAKSTQHMEEFYRMLNEVNQLKRTVDQYRSEGLDDKANELLEEQGGILKSRRSLSRTQQQVRVVRNKIELIQRDRTMNAEEKRKRIDELLARRNDLVYQAVNKNRENWE
ncbi:LPD38 domain-containing protein [Aeromonas veronii]|uniref:LPD38 domain-containing protein n=1 Tax=Aeromonas veronii TaxID=654 RepID=UPI0015D59E43|nr:LPD38 domain-containing protein [Aeromonas veronii]